MGERLQLQATGNAQRRSYGGQYRHNQLNDEFPSFAFHGVCKGLNPPYVPPEGGVESHYGKGLNPPYAPPQGRGLGHIMCGGCGLKVIGYRGRAVFISSS